MGYFGWLTGSAPYVLVSDISPEEFAVRFRASVAAPKYAELFGRGGLGGGTVGPFRGVISGSGGFQIWENIYGYNSWLPRFSGRVVESDSGCEIRGRFELHPLVAVFTAMWLATAFLFGLVFCLFPGDAGDAPWGRLIGGAVLIGLFVLTARAEVISGKKATMHLAFLEETFSARLLKP